MAALADQFPAVLLTGARQVGKTALMRQLFPRARYVCLDLPSMAAEAQDSPGAFLAGLGDGPVIIDEIQYAPGLFGALKAAIDQDRRPGRYLLTGSQSFLLMQGVSESLAGRCAVAQLHPLSWEEVRSSGRHTAEEYLALGGYPELYSGRAVSASEWYSAYTATYLERDVRNVLRVGSLRDFDRFVRAAALRTAGLLSYSDLARDVGIAPNTAKQWVSVLQASGLVHLLEPYHRSLGKRLIKSPKLIFGDTGLAAFLLGLSDWAAILRSPLAGQLWETHVINQALRRAGARGPQAPLWFWRTVSGDEVDLVLEQGGRFVAVECKLSEHPGAEAAAPIAALARFYGEKAVLRGYVACRTARPYAVAPGVTAVDGSLAEFRP